MAIILNLAIQNSNEAPDSSTPFPSQMEVDWVRYYQRNPCQDTNITDASQITLSNEVFNAILGDDVTINCNFDILAGQQLEILGKNNISIGPGFKIEAGSIVNLRIESTICE